uniref:Uncharacterized protein n=1 Tax=Fagus sylvatica TaxID=28930 RepID=A0A2N9FZF4_FAGSY
MTTFPQEDWVHTINEISNNNTPFRIRAFIVPDSLRDSKLEAYFPQIVGLGPLHHSRLQLQLMHMHIYKLGVVTKIHHKLRQIGQFGQNSFEGFVTELMREVPSVRNCYPKHLDAQDFHIACIMAIDGLFLFVLLLHYGIRNESNNGILQNIERSPLDVPEDYPASRALGYAHLLEFLYHLIMFTELPEPLESPEPPELLELSETIAFELAEVFEVVVQLVGGLNEIPWSKLFNSSNKAPVEKEILIPTASKLCSVGVQFVCTNHVTATEFEVEGDPLESKSLVLTRFFEMMNGIIETEEDVKVLKYHGILQIESMKDDEVVKIFSGMSKSKRLANPPNIEKAIEEANKYYNGQLDVMICKFIKNCLSPLWSIIRKIWVVFLLIILAFRGILLSLWLR